MNNLVHIFELLETILRVVPFPVLIVIGFIVLVLIGQLKGGTKQPTEIIEYDEVAQRERLRQMQYQQAGQPVPPLPSERQKKKRGRGNQRMTAQQAMLAAQAAAAARADAEAKARQRAALAAPSAAVEPITARPTRPTIAGNARTFFHRGGLKDAFILSEILGKPKSAE